MMFPKFEYIRSQELLRNAREIPCQNCGTVDGTVVAAHSNQLKHGKGRSIKASDIYIASLCFKCHYRLDQDPVLSREQRDDMWGRAHARTVNQLVSLGLWPKHLPIPKVD